MDFGEFVDGVDSPRAFGGPGIRAGEQYDSG
jgi:hypothetical protein